MVAASAIVMKRKHAVRARNENSVSAIAQGAVDLGAREIVRSKRSTGTIVCSVVCRPTVESMLISRLEESLNECA